MSEPTDEQVAALAEALQSIHMGPGGAYRTHGWRLTSAEERDGLQAGCGTRSARQASAGGRAVSEPTEEQVAALAEALTPFFDDDRAGNGLASRGRGRADETRRVRAVRDSAWLGCSLLFIAALVSFAMGWLASLIWG